MVPFALEYYGGGRAAIGVLCRSNRPCKHKAKLKFSSARKARLLHSNIFVESALGGSTAYYVRSDKQHQPLTTAPKDTECFWLFYDRYVGMCWGEKAPRCCNFDFAHDRVAI